MKKMRYAVGVDIGGTTIKAVLINDKNRIIKKIETPIQRGKGKKGIIKNVFFCVENMISGIQRRQIIGIGIGAAGLVNRKKGILVHSPNIKQLNKTPIKKIIEKKFKIKTKIENDANCAALAESRANKKRNLVCLTLGTGVGSGIILNNKMYYGKGGGAEFGHTVIEKEGIKCVCGNRGCLEEYVSARAICRTAKKYGIKENDVKKIEELARKNKKARLVFEEMGKNLGIGLANIVNIFDPELIILTGGISKAADFFLKTAVKELNSRAWFKPCTVKVSKLNSYGGAIGAALLF